MNVQVIENYGLVKVSSKSKRPLHRTYIKCFSKRFDGSTKFHKDGYTDIRGTFDYVTLNQDNLNDIQSFSILVVSEQYGSVIREAGKPSKMAKFDSEEVGLISKKLKIKQEELF